MTESSGRQGLPGDYCPRVAIAMRNNPEWAIGFAAATLIGAIVVPVNSWGKTEELTYAITDSGSRTLICALPRYRLIEDKLDEYDIDVILVAAEEDVPQAAHVESYDSLVAAGKGLAYDIAQPAPEDQCLILYTSGTTGFPKGVVHRHIGVTQSLFNMMYLGMLVMSLEGAREFKAGAKVETPLLTVPLFHATGLLSGFYLPLATGQKVVMMYKWDTVQALQLIQEEKVTSLSSVPAIAASGWLPRHRLRRWRSCRWWWVKTTPPL